MVYNSIYLVGITPHLRSYTGYCKRQKSLVAVAELPIKDLVTPQSAKLA
jgi:hypothetical protein